MAIGQAVHLATLVLVHRVLVRQGIAVLTKLQQAHAHACPHAKGYLADEEEPRLHACDAAAGFLPLVGGEDVPEHGVTDGPTHVCDERQDLGQDEGAHARRDGEGPSGHARRQAGKRHDLLPRHTVRHDAPEWEEKGLDGILWRPCGRAHRIKERQVVDHVVSGVLDAHHADPTTAHQPQAEAEQNQAVAVLGGHAGAPLEVLRVRQRHRGLLQVFDDGRAH
mmetsp:Transcript_98996/g.263015  ORF Transcript_98996/g.263015 Transcript_98996/m.263015 type:complete len:222 (-) Transcript_98996:133-798(-)